MTTSRSDVLIDGVIAAAMSVAGSESPEDTQSRTGRTKHSLDIMIIVGGGSARAVLAAGPSADVQRRVLLLEAAQNFKPNSYRAAITDANVVAAPAFNWHYQADDHVLLGPDIPVPRGRVIGSNSPVNAAAAVRARPADFDRWAKRFIEGCSWEEVLPAYRRWRTRHPASMRGTVAAALPDLPAHGGG